MDELTEGRIVHYVLQDGEHRPAIVVRVWRNECGAGSDGVNLLIFVDGSNDNRAVATDFHGEVTPFLWATSVCFDDQDKKPGTCHWMEMA